MAVNTVSTKNPANEMERYAFMLEQRALEQKRQQAAAAKPKPMPKPPLTGHPSTRVTTPTNTPQPAAGTAENAGHSAQNPAYDGEARRIAREQAAHTSGVSAGDGLQTPKPVSHDWAPEDRSKIDGYIRGALHRGGGSIEKAFADLRDQRQKVENYYDTNMAVAADYLRARWETQNCGPGVAATEVEAYMGLKRLGGVPKEGPGPVSPYSEVQLEYMRRGVEDEINDMSIFKRIWWASPAGAAVGTARAAVGVLRKEG